MKAIRTEPPQSDPVYYVKVLEENKKLRFKLKMMEISFEQINNSRNDMIKQLAECESYKWPE